MLVTQLLKLNMNEPPIGRDVLQTVMPDIHAALEHLLLAWDHVGAAQRVLDFEITTGELSDLAAGIWEAYEVRELVTLDELSQWVEKIRRAPK